MKSFEVKWYRLLFVFVLTALLLTLPLKPLGKGVASTQHGFSVREYEEFHDVLHPLEHEALPKKDFRRIRAESRELVKRGHAIVKLGVPDGTSEERKEEFTKELKDLMKRSASSGWQRGGALMHNSRQLTVRSTIPLRCWLRC
ncbi:MAG: hypothetical protein ACRD8U_09935 [Pyrinomonadaceae bacterium]